MRDYQSHEVRNVAIVGTTGVGKTALVEGMIRLSNTMDRFVNSSEPVLDFDLEEKKRGMSIYNSIVPIEWENQKINFIDTPGYVDFVGEYQSAIAIADSAILVVDAKNIINENVIRIWKDLHQKRIPSIIFINKLDTDDVDFTSAYNLLREVLGNVVIPFELPIIENQHIVGTVNVLSDKTWYRLGDKASRVKFYEVPENLVDLIADFKDQIFESVAMSDETLMEKYFAQDKFTDEELRKGLSIGVNNGEIHPVYAGSATQDIGIERLMTMINENFPVFNEKGMLKVEDLEKNEEIEINRDVNEVLCVSVFKTTIDPFVGKMSYVKVKSGVLTMDSLIYNASKDIMEKVGQVFIVRGKQQTAIGKLFAGDIGVVTKLENTSTNDTLCAKNRKFELPKIKFEEPMYVKAVFPKTKQDEDKLNPSLMKLVEEDPTFKVKFNEETKQTVVYTVGDQHLDVILAKLKQKYKVEVYLETPKIPYRETIKNKAIGEGRHKKQSGGHGQFAHVFVEFEPQNVSEDLIFEEKVFGGSVPRNYFPAVEVGLQESMEKGVLGGFPMVNIKATLFDGKYHDVDSSEMAFKLAARLAYKDGITKAKPVLLEPYVQVLVETNEEYMGTIIGDLNKRRGNIEGMDVTNDHQIIRATVPYSEMLEYAMDLRQMTQGSATYQQKVIDYVAVPMNLVDKILESR